MKPRELPSSGLIRLGTVLEVIHVSKSLWYKGVKDGRFPQPVHLGPRTSVWRVSDIMSFIEKARERGPR